MLVFETGQLGNPKYVINFPTKRHWRGKSKLVDIEAGLVALVDEVRRRGIQSIAIPPLGCGLGGLDWADVRPRIVAAFESLPEVRVMLFEPGAAPAPSERAVSKEVPRLTPGRAVLVGLIDRYVRGLADPWVTLLEVHKLMYFAQEAGEPLNLRFNKAHYGPYAENLRHVLRTVEGHLLTGYADGGDDPTKQLELVPGAVRDAESFLDQHELVQQRFERVVELVRGFETPFGMELLATVHWVAAREGAREPASAVRAVYAWNARKRQFSEDQIELALRNLAEKGWLAEAQA
jgi:O-acetyl-ADP-ribose deacetylase (regulator of RNase III)